MRPDPQHTKKRKLHSKSSPPALLPSDTKALRKQFPESSFSFFWMDIAPSKSLGEKDTVATEIVTESISVIEINWNSKETLYL